jgi:hypothetical protein
MRSGEASHYHRWRLPIHDPPEVSLGDEVLFVEEAYVIGRAIVSGVQQGHLLFSGIEPVTQPFKRAREERPMYCV